MQYSTTTEEIIPRLIKELEFIQAHLPEQASWFMGEYSVASCTAFLAGFGAACHALTVAPDPSILKYVAHGRGWTVDTASYFSGISDQMRERGLTDGQIIDELFLLLIEALKFMARPPKKWPTLLRDFDKPSSLGG